MGGVLLHLAPQPLDADVDQAGVAQVRVVPHPLQQQGPGEDLARVKAVLRRQERPAAEPVLRFGDLVIDPGGMAVTRRGVDLRLTPTELRLLLELARRPGQVFTRALLLERVWDYSYLGDSRLVDVCVQRLRGKVEDDPSHPTLVQTVRGVGYKLVPPP